MIPTIQSQKNPTTVGQVLRTTLAAVIALWISRMTGLPEAYWAAISALVVMQSNWGTSLPISLQSFAGTALGAAIGALFATYWPRKLLAFTLATLFIGMACAVLRLERVAYRNACTTLVIVVLVPHVQASWIAALHRFIEVSIGIAVALLVVATWPEK